MSALDPSPTPAAAASRGSGRLIAAVDLGSNSFHMVVARLAHGEPQVVDRLRERVALAQGLDEERRLTEPARERALECLRRFGQRLGDLPDDGVRAVGTSAMRQLKDSAEFLRQAEEALGRGIDIVSGAEEARLVYLGVAHDLADDEGRRLVVDIGGGSTECVLGEKFEALRTDSLHMGCVVNSRRWFPEGVLDARSFERAGVDARLELRPIERIYRTLGWESSVGSSGTNLAIAAVLRESGWSKNGITPKGLRRLERALIEAGHVDALRLPGLSPERASVLPGGLSILRALFDALGIERMTVSTSALREGLLYDLVGRIRHEDVRDRTILRLAAHYHVDGEQAARVRRTALAIHAGVAEAWKLARPEDRSMLAWAARLHEVGLAIAFGGHHRHGAYIVAHTDMPGFTRREQLGLAALILSQRRRLSRERVAELVDSGRERILRLAVPLRLAALLERGRGTPKIRLRGVEADADGLVLAFDEDWMESHPLTRADLELEARRLREVGIALATRPE